MPRQAPAFTQADIVRATKGVIAAGLTVYRVEVGRDGGIVVVTNASAPETPESAYDRWRREQDAREAQGN